MTKSFSGRYLHDFHMGLEMDFKGLHKNNMHRIKLVMTLLLSLLSVIASCRECEMTTPGEGDASAASSFLVCR